MEVKKKKVIFATTNKNKIIEVEQMMSPIGYDIIGLHQLQFEGDIPENSNTIEGNAREKTEFIYAKYGAPCFSEDTGLEVIALNNRPGVYTARYAGPMRDASDNMEKVLEELMNIDDRRAQFRTVIAYKLHDGIFTFSGKVTGRIDFQRTGIRGFGYDPIFIPDGFDMSFGELASHIKNKISHRAKAWEKLRYYLESH